MASTIQIKRGTGSAVPSGLADGELAINLDSGQLYFGSGSTSVNSFRFTNLTADNYTVSSSVTNYTFQTLSGSSDFGDDTGDIHNRTGSLNISGALNLNGPVNAITITGNINANGNIVGDDNTNITNISQIECDAIASDANNTTKIQLDNTQIISLVNDTDVFDVTETLFTHGVPVKFQSHITASANISASGEIEANTFKAAGNVDFNGDLDVDGTTNLDAVDIDGNVQLDGTFTVGVDDTGYDVTLFGATANRKAIWDASQDHLKLYDNTKLVLGTGPTEVAFDTSLYHDGTDFTFSNSTGKLNITNAGGDTNIKNTGNNASINLILDASPAGATVNDGTVLISGSAEPGIRLDVKGEITASGNISSSGEIKANTLDIASTSNFADDITLGDTKKLKGARIVISASSNNNIYGGSTFHQNVDFNSGIDVTGDSTLDGNLDLTSTNAVLDIQGQGDASDATGDTGALRCEGGASIAKKLFVGTDLNIGGQITSNITASGNISASGTIKSNGFTSTATYHAGPIRVIYNLNDTVFLGDTAASQKVSIQGADVTLNPDNGIANVEGSSTTGFKVFSTHTATNRDVGLTLSASANGQQYTLGLNRANNTFVIAPSDVDTAPANSVFELDATGNITASGHISASGLISGKIATTDVSTDASHYFVMQTAANTLPLISNGLNFNPSTDLLTVGVGGISTTGNVITGNITASGDISASGDIIASSAFLNNGASLKFAEGTSNEVRLRGIGGNLLIMSSSATGLIINPGQGHITASGNISSSGTITADKVVSDNIQAGWHGSTTRIKILVSDFIPDDIGRPAMIDDTGSDRWLESHGTGKLFASIPIPTGFKATECLIYGSGTSAITVYEADINSKTVTSKGTGNIGTAIDGGDFTHVTSDTTNYLFLELAQASGEEVYGGYVTIEAV